MKRQALHEMVGRSQEGCSERSLELKDAKVIFIAEEH